MTISYASKSLTDSEVNFALTGKEFCYFVWLYAFQRSTFKNTISLWTKTSKRHHVRTTHGSTP